MNEDIVLAQKIICNNYNNKENTRYNENSIIYRGTNEWIASNTYIDLIKNRKKILSIIGSGDQILNSILVGSSNITGYDISRFPKYYLYLKIAALKILNKEEYISFFVGTYYDELLNIDVYDKVRKELYGEYLLFWDSIFDYFDQIEINESKLFSSEPINKYEHIRNNLFLQKDNYYKLRNKIDRINIKLYNDNIFELISKLDEEYDLINLSSIIHYPKDNFGTNNSFKKFKSFLYNLPLNKDGIAINYLYGTDSYWNKKKLKRLSYGEPDHSILVYKHK